MEFKKIPLDESMKMTEAILNNPLFLFVLERFEINLGFEDKTVADVCSENHVSLSVFLMVCNLFNDPGLTEVDLDKIDDIEQLIKYLKNSHRFYLEEKYPEISRKITSMIEQYPGSEIKMVQGFFEEYIKEVTEHIHYENNIVFPYVIELFRKGTEAQSPKSLKHYAVIDYKKHHSNIEEKLTDLKNLLIKYLPQKGEMSIRRSILFDLFELEYDLNIHQKIEDTILIPLVEEIENSIKNQKP
ncbi:MAG: hypothetical protein DRJ05_16320 [Bacteroidetes bacterium]|nr:MAG: hypothetical protein DRJ05_16320 [Bacteroidota bacterium]